MVSAENFRSTYNGNSLATSFAYGLKVNDKTYLRVVRTNSSGVDYPDLVVDVDYTVNGVGSDNASNWTITYPITGSPLATGEKLTIIPKLPLKQLTDLPNQGDYNSTVIEDALDYAITIDQQQQEQLDRCVKVAVGSSDNPTTLISDLKQSSINAQAAASSAMTSANTATTQAGIATTKAAQAAASAASVNLPSITGNGLKFLRAKSDASGLEYTNLAGSIGQSAVYRLMGA